MISFGAISRTAISGMRRVQRVIDNAFSIFECRSVTIPYDDTSVTIPYEDTSVTIDRSESSVTLDC